MKYTFAPLATEPGCNYMQNWYDMQQNNFTEFGTDGTNIRTMEHKGLTLVYSETDGRFMLPQPQGAKAKILFDEQAQTFIQVTITDPSFVYRDRTATSPDGTIVQERLFIAKDKNGNELQLPDIDFQKTIFEGQVMEFKRRALEMAMGWMPVFYLGVIVCMVSFFWQLAYQSGLLAEAFAAGSTAAIAEVGYLLAWAGGLVALAVFCYYVLPVLFRAKRRASVIENDLFEQGQSQGEPTNTTNIVVNNIQGSGNTAQDYINRRNV